MSQVRYNLNVNQPLVNGYPNVRVPLVVVQPVTGGYPNARANFFTTQPLVEGYPFVRVSFVVFQALFAVEPEPKMATIPFPGFGNSTANPAIPAGADPALTKLPGLAFSVHKKPMFKTKLIEATSGNEVRTSYTEFPRWEFELTYEFLEDRSGATSSLKTIMGFFTDMKGSFQSWLFKDPDDYVVANAKMGTADGVTTQFYFNRYLGSNGERIGQIDTANTITLYRTPAEARTVPAPAGPYTITVTNAATYVADGGVTKAGVAMTKVTAAPTVGQYSVNTATGVYTFAAADANVAVVITYRYTLAPALYTVTLPNKAVFVTAPAAGAISADFQFYFVCRFSEDEQDFEKFMDKLWSLQTCSFRSILQ